MHLFNISSTIKFCEARGLSLCFGAYAHFCPAEEILDIGFNSNSGYVYIALENGVSICSLLGEQVTYLVTNYENGEEHFFASYQDAQDHVFI